MSDDRSTPPDPLLIPKAALGRGSPIRLTVLPDSAAVVARFAEDLLAEYRAAREAGRRKVVFIVPVGPIYGLLDPALAPPEAQRLFPDPRELAAVPQILESRKVRIYMNREWQCDIVRKILHGPVTAAVPASLLQEHPDARFTIADCVGDPPEPTLR